MTDSAPRSAGGATSPRVIALNLPQFHPIPENDRWWGRGFTEWTNVVKARPLFPGHTQPHLPADLGFYDLRLPEARAAQASLAREHGVSGFCYYHYWFNGRRLLERPVDEIVASGQPDFPFCLCWANENWTRRWDGLDREVLVDQKYSAEDDVEHIRSLLPALTDSRYIRIDGKPLFLVYRSSALPDSVGTADRWRREAERAGLPGLFLVRVESFPSETGDPRPSGFDAALEFQPRWQDVLPHRIQRRRWWHRSRLGNRERAFAEHAMYSYRALVDQALARPMPDYPLIRCACPSWDNTARRARGGIVLLDSSPEDYQRWLGGILAQARRHPPVEGPGAEPLVFVNAWNEWAEGNHLEPCQRWGRAYLEATGRAVASVG